MMPTSQRFSRQNLINLTAGLFVVLLCSACATAPTKSNFQRAWELLQHGEKTKARRLLEHELNQHPQNQQARYDLAVLLQETGHLNDAIRLYEENLRFGWHLPSAINLASLYMQRRQHDKAADILKRTAREFPHEAIPWYMLGKQAMDQGKPQIAAKYFANGIKADPNNGFARLWHAIFLSRQKKHRQAVTEGAKAVSLLPDCAVCWRSYGDILVAAGEKKKAAAAFQRSLAIEPNIETRKRLISTLRDIGETERARRMQEALDRWLQQRI